MWFAMTPPVRAWAMGRRVHTIAAELLPSGSDDLETLARLWDNAP